MRCFKENVTGGPLPTGHATLLGKSCCAFLPLSMTDHGLFVVTSVSVLFAEEQCFHCCECEKKEMDWNHFSVHQS